MTNISLLLITKNESTNLDKWKIWLKKIKPINELIVVDSQSTDDTVKKLQKLSSKKINVKVFDAINPQNFASLRNQGIEKCNNTWVLWLDADETPSSGFINFINRFDASKYNYSFLRHDIFLGKKLKHGETANQDFIRLFNKNYGKFVGNVHEVWQTTKPVIHTKHHLKHQPHHTFYSFIKKINLYSSLRAKELKKLGVKTNPILILFYPLAKFIHNYFLRLGFLDGTPGIIFALGMSFHSFLVRAKLWHLLQNSSP